MKSWTIFLKEKEQIPQIPQEEEGYTLFFKKDGRYYAVKEGNRIIFAKIKTKDIKDLSTDKEEIKFLAKDILSGKEVAFTPKDVKKIEVCEKEEVEKNVSVHKE